MINVPFKNGRRALHVVAKFASGAVLLFLVTGCVLFGIETGHRVLSIKQHKFEFSKIEVPQGQPFVLTVNAVDDRDLIISAPDLGFTAMRVPASPASGSWGVQSQVLPGRHARLPLGPLQAGSYSIRCDCHGHESEAVIVVR